MNNDDTSIEFRYTQAEYEVLARLLRKLSVEVKSLRKERMLLRLALRKYNLTIPTSLSDLMEITK
jgi:hypothetical protein